jgi:two-component system, OmpR family, response regulator MprA
LVTRVLLVDDDLQILPLLQRGLAYEGFEVYTATDGESGLAAAKQYEPHIVLLDIAMPGLDGFEVCRRAVLRRHKAGGEPLVYADLQLDQATREVQRAGHRIELTSQEYTLLLFFMRHPRQVLGRELILERVWGYHAEIDSHVLEVYIGHLRQKLEVFGGTRLLQTIRGYGYALRE